MGLERLRIALLRGFDIPGGQMRDDALDWVKEQEDRLGRRQHVILVGYNSRCRRGVDSCSDASITLVLIVWVVIVRPRRKAVELGVNDAGGTPSV